MSDRGPRCPVCEAEDFRATRRGLDFVEGARAFPLECSHCGLLVDRGASRAVLDAALAASMAASDLRLSPTLPLGFEAYTARTAALRLGLLFEPADARQVEARHAPYHRRPAAGGLRPLADLDPLAISVAILCRPQEEAQARRLAAELGTWSDDVLLLLDAAEAHEREAEGDGLRLAARPLGGDFSAQRNAAQDLARRDWVLQLDADETMAPAALSSLGRLAALAERDGCLCVGLPRRNLVDGVLSALHPDIQYRLNRASVRYRGRVHERPDLPGGWRDSFIAPGAAIDHHLARAHVLSRSKAYEAMAPGEGRLFEMRRLLTPFHA
ncbi:hypothetical protein [Aurantimonas sp. Leaf443]|uniref:hypothetical protein n=1 Tax=Aurantimonas sp. Leaf443 TaxID=1736378 RepID=UPI000B18AF1E|nr:hypothetical protein [Aurantimonas sp. Leaf443]